MRGWQKYCTSNTRLANFNPMLNENQLSYNHGIWGYLKVLVISHFYQNLVDIVALVMELWSTMSMGSLIMVSLVFMLRFRLMGVKGINFVGKTQAQYQS